MMFITVLDNNMVPVGIIKEFWDDSYKVALKDNFSTFDFTCRSGKVELGEDMYVLVPYKGIEHKLFIIKRVEEPNQFESVVETEIASTGELVNEYLMPTTINALNTTQAFQKVLQMTEWELGDVEVDSLTTIEWKDITSVKEALINLAQEVRAELDYVVEFNGSTVISKKVHVRKQLGANNGILFTYGKDVKGITKTVDSSELITAVYALGNGDITLDGYTPETHLDEGYRNAGAFAVNEDAYQKYNVRGRNKFGFIKSDADNQFELWEDAVEHLRKNAEPKISFHADIVAFNYGHKDLGVGDTVKVKDSRMVLDSRVVEIDYCFSDASKSSVILGDYEPAGITVSTKFEREVGKIESEIPTIVEKVIEDTDWDFTKGMTEEQLEQFNKAKEDLERADKELKEAQELIDETGKRLEALAKEQEEAPRIDVGKDFPSNPREGDVFYKKDASGTVVAYYVYTDGEWALSFAPTEPSEMSSKIKEEILPEINRVNTQINTLTGRVDNVQFTVGNKADKSQLTLLETDINLRVKKGDVINQINIGNEYVLIQGNKIAIDGNTTFTNTRDKINNITKGSGTSTVIDGGKIDTYSISANKINVGTLSALSSNLGSITGGELNIGNRFEVNSNGYLTATGADISGYIYASGGVFNGTVYATDGKFTGEVQATKGTFTGTINARGGTITGDMLVSGTLRGATIEGGRIIGTTGSDYGDVLAFGNWKSDGPKINYQSNAIRLANNRYNYVRVGTANVAFVAEGNEIGNFNKDGLYVVKDQTIGGNLTVKGTVNGQILKSARELKKNIEPFSCPLGQTAIEKVVSTPVYKYNYIDDEDTDWKYTGVIIDEAPAEIVNMDGKHINIYSMVSVLWKAVQEQQEEIERLKGGK